MATVQWADDVGYENWVEGNPTGYIANIKKSSPAKRKSTHIKIHRATCKLPDNSNPDSVNPWTGNDYIKVTSENLGDLLFWLKENGFEENAKWSCGHCDRNGDVSQHLLSAVSPHELPVVYPDEISPEQQTLIEGAAKKVLVNQYERNQNARAKCIRHWGATCYVCCFDFEKAYGPMGKGFIHVHHLIDIASIGAEYEINPIEDLRPVCPNCHAMLHTERPAINIEKLKSMLAVSRDS